MLLSGRTSKELVGVCGSLKLGGKLLCQGVCDQPPGKITNDDASDAS